MQAPVGKRNGADQRVGKTGQATGKGVREGYRILSAANRTGCVHRHPAGRSPLRNWPGESPQRLILLARVSRFFRVALRLNGDQTAVDATGSASSAKGRKTMPDVGSSAVAAPTMVM